MTAHFRSALLLTARDFFEIDDTLHALDGISVALQRRFGFEEVPVELLGRSYLEADPGVDAQLAERALSLVSRTRLNEILTDADQRYRDTELSEIHEPYLHPVKKWYGAREKAAAYTDRIHREHNDFRRISVVLETDPAETVGVGNFQIFGPGQLVREYLWALSGVLPRDTGAPLTDPYQQFIASMELSGGLHGE